MSMPARCLHHGTQYSRAHPVRDRPHYDLPLVHNEECDEGDDCAGDHEPDCKYATLARNVHEYRKCTH